MANLQRRSKGKTARPTQSLFYLHSQVSAIPSTTLTKPTNAFHDGAPYHRYPPLPTFNSSNVVSLQPDTASTNQSHPQANTLHLTEQLQLADVKIRTLTAQVLYLKNQLTQANRQAQAAQQVAVADSAQKQFHRAQPSTYIVPKRRRTPRFEWLTQSIAFAIFLAVSTLCLIAAISAVSHTSPIWIALAPLLLNIVRALFLLIAFSSVLSVVYTLRLHQLS